MANVPVPYYYNQFSTKERSYIDYMGELNKSLGSEIGKNVDRQIAANALFAGEIKSTLINNQIATETALYNHTQQIDGTLKQGFSSVSRQLGDMSSSMSMGLAFLNSTVQESSKAICKKLDDINKTLENPLFTQARELYNRALQRYSKGFYEEALKDLHESIKKNETDPFSYFLLGQTYLFGISEFSNVIDLNSSIESLKNAVKYITPDAKNHDEARPMAAEIWFYLGLAYQTKANDDLHKSNKTDYEKNLNDAKVAYGRSWDYSQKMLESLYNLARCKSLTNDENGAIQDLIKVVLKDHGYCIKAYTESDFSNSLKDKFFSQLKRELYPKVKASFDQIIQKKNNFQGPYSENLKKLFSMQLPKTFSEETPPFDMLESSVNFPKMISIFEKEYLDHLNKLKEEEQKRKEREREQQAQQRRVEKAEEQSRKQQQSMHWKNSGLCPSCGGRFSFFRKKNTIYNQLYYVCKSCGNTEMSNDYLDKKKRRIWKTIGIITAIIGSLMLQNLFMLIPFAIIFFVPSDHWEPRGGFNGFFKFIRIMGIIVQIIISIVKIVSNISSPIIIIGSIILVFACFMAHRRSLTGVYGN